jgi:phosphoribosylformylglycinamidine synthase PurS subunit
MRRLDVRTRPSVGRAHGYLARPVPTAEAPRVATAARKNRVEVRVELKAGILDAEAESVEKSLRLLGLPELTHVTTARIYDLEFDGLTEAAARARAQQAVDRLLANPVIHRVTIRPVPD